MPYFTYILTNDHNTTLYVGVTNDLSRRLFEHQEKFNKGFTERYNINKLVYAEKYESIETAIMREKQIKSWNRQRKINLVESVNKDWTDIMPY